MHEKEVSQGGMPEKKWGSFLQRKQGSSKLKLLTAHQLQLQWTLYCLQLPLLLSFISFPFRKKMYYFTLKWRELQNPCVYNYCQESSFPHCQAGDVPYMTETETSAV